MRDLVILFIHLLTTAARLAGRGGLRSVVAKSVLLKHQLLILNRSRQRAPHLRLSDRLVAGACALWMRPSRLIRSAIVLKPSTLLRLHQALRNRKYRILFSSQHRRRPGPKPPWPRTHRCRRPDEAAQSHLGLSAHRSAAHPWLRKADRWLGS